MVDITKVAISGKKRSGKSTAAKALFEYFLGKGLKPSILSHSTWIKYLVIKGLCMKPNRDTLQLFGSELMIDECQRLFGTSDFWTNMVISDAKHLESNDLTNLFIVDDVRFEHQAEALRKDGYILVRLKTNPELQATRENGKDDGIKDHVSETALDHLEGKDYFDVECEAGLTINEIVKEITDHIYWTPSDA